MKNIILIYLLLISCVESSLLSAQFPGAEYCHDAYVFCSLDAMNGFAFNTSVTTRSNCVRCCVSYHPYNRSCVAFLRE